MSDNEETAPAPDDEANLKLIVGLIAGAIFFIAGLIFAYQKSSVNYALLAALGSALIIWTTASENAGQTIEIMGGIMLGLGAIGAVANYTGQSSPET